MTIAVPEKLTGPALDEYLCTVMHDKQMMFERLLRDPDEHWDEPECEVRTLDYDEIAAFWVSELREYTQMEVGVTGNHYTIDGDLKDAVDAMMNDRQHFTAIMTQLVYRTPDIKTKKVWRAAANALRDNMPLSLEKALRKAFREATSVGNHRIKVTHDNRITIYKPVFSQSIENYDAA